MIPAFLRVSFGVQVSSIIGSTLISRTTTPLSDAACRTAKPRDRAYKLFDGDGLYLLVQANGRKGWRMRYVKPDGKEGLTSFGNYPVISLTDARTKWLEVKRLLVQGIDPYKTSARVSFRSAATPKRRISIFKLNLLTGWTGIGWLVALYRALVFPVTDK